MTAGSTRGSLAQSCQAPVPTFAPSAPGQIHVCHSGQCFPVDVGASRPSPAPSSLRLEGGSRTLNGHLSSGGGLRPLSAQPPSKVWDWLILRAINHSPNLTSETMLLPAEPRPSQSAPRWVPADPGTGRDSVGDTVETRASPPAPGLGSPGNCPEVPSPPEKVSSGWEASWGTRRRAALSSQETLP